MTSTRRPGIRALLIASTAMFLGGCASYPIPKLPPDPVMANPPPRPPGFENKGWGGSFAGGGGGDVTNLGRSENAPYPTTTDVRGLFVPEGGMPTVPGVNDPWFGIRDEPVKNRDTVVADVDASIRQLGGPYAVTRNSTATPGLEAQHTEAVRRFETAMRDLEQKRDAMNLTTDPAIWEQNKDQFHDAWEAAQRAYAQAKATGN